MSKGWVSIHRRFQEHWIYDRKPFCYAAAWVDILLEANHADGKSLIKGTLVECKRGQSINSLKTWARRWGWTVSATRHFLGLLEKDGMLRTENVSVTTRLTVVNYDSYQDQQHAEGTQKARTGHAEGTHADTNNNGNNENNGNKDTCVELVPSSPPVITLQTNTGDEFPVTQGMHDEYAPLYPSVDVMAELRKMKAWLISNKDKRKTKRGMTRFINSWLSKAQDRGGTKQRQGNGRTYFPDKNEYDQLRVELGISEGDEGEV